MSPIKKIEASVTSRVEIIFNEDAYLKNEKIQISINLLNVSNLYEADVRIKLDNRQLVPQLQGNQYFCFNALSIFEEVPVINDFVDDTYLRLKLVKSSDISTGYPINGKNNLTNLYLISQLKIENIFNILNDANIQIRLYDINGNLIPVELNFSEKLKYEWTTTNYKMEVYSKIPSFENDIIVTNRNKSDYNLTIDHDINPLIVNDYYVMIIIYDETNGEIIKESRQVKVVDETPPSITTTIEDSCLEIVDINLENIDFSNYFKLSDNYDTDSHLVYTYYDSSECIMHNEQEFKKYLESNLEGILEVYGIDMNQNKSEILKIDVKMKDTTAPKVINQDEIKIGIEDINEFNLASFLEITDNYDQNPNFTVSYLKENGEQIFDIYAFLTFGQPFFAKIMAFDSSGNYSDEVIIKVEVIDTVSPVIEVQDIILNDEEVENFQLENYIHYFDNVSLELELIIKIYLSKNNLHSSIQNEDYNLKLIEVLKQRQLFYLEVEVIDQADNFIVSDLITVTVIDNTPPVINILSIVDGNVYESISKIEYKITDNYDSNPTVLVYLNGKLYENSKILPVGDYIFKIVASDINGNENEKTVKFKIETASSKLPIDIPLMFDQKVTLYIVMILLGISGLILVFRLINFYKERNKYQNR